LGACDRAALASIDAARKREDLGPLELPNDYEQLSVARQLVAVTNAERLARGLPAWDGPRKRLSALAARGASLGDDPAGPIGTTWASVMASGVLTVLQADYEWLYNDGPGGTNAGCTATDHTGCWDHRDDLLSPWPGSIGAAFRRSEGGRLVLAEVMVRAQ